MKVFTITPTHIALVTAPKPPFKIDETDVDSEGYVISERLQSWLLSMGYGYICPPENAQSVTTNPIDNPWPMHPYANP